MPIARQPSTTFRSPVRSSSSAAFTPSSAASPEVYTAPCSAGSSPAMARSSVDLPDPFLPMIADHVAVVDHERDAADGVDFPDGDPALPLDQAHQRGGRGSLVTARAVDAVDHVQVVDHDGRVSHGDHSLGSSAEQAVSCHLTLPPRRRTCAFMGRTVRGIVSDNTPEIWSSRFRGDLTGHFRSCRVRTDPRTGRGVHGGGYVERADAPVYSL